MKMTSIPYLSCPCCNHSKLDIEMYDGGQGNVIEGRMVCSSCGMWYRIEKGIADLLPLALRNRYAYKEFAVRHGLSAPVFESLDDGDQRFSQIDFFKRFVDTYEKEVANSHFYEALYEVTFLRWVRKNLHGVSRVVDLGCGTGKQLLMLAREGIPTIGIDISEDMLLRARRNIDSTGLGELIDLIIADAQNPPIRNESFNACILYGTLHHVPDPQATLSNIAEKIIPGGFVYTADPHKSPVRFIFDWMMKVWTLYKEEANENPLISREQLMQWLNRAGFKSSIYISTYLPPHLMYLLSVKTNIAILRASDLIFNRIPVVRMFGGAIIAQAVKTN